MLRKRITLGDIAKAVSLSRSGVSRALRNDPRIPLATCERVQKVAFDLGYRPDTEIASYLRVLRNRRDQQQVESIAYLSFGSKLEEPKLIQYSTKIFQGASERAERLGYRLDKFIVEGPKKSHKSIDRILKTRAIRGCLLSVRSNVADLGIDFSNYSVAAITYALPGLSLSRSVPSVYSNVTLAFNEALKLGYRRIGLMLDEFINVRTSFQIQAAFLNMQYRHPELTAIPIFNLPGTEVIVRPEKPKTADAKHFMNWLSRKKPDIILASRAAFFPWLEASGFRCPADIGFVSLEGVEDTQNYAHIDQKPHEIGGAGIDILISLLNRNLRGFACHPSMVCTDGQWVTGPTVRKMD
jgi:LacI family transcriptional regulator